MREHTGPKTTKPVGLGKHSPKQRKKTDQQCIGDENEPGTCAFSDKSWQAHQGPSEQLRTSEQLGKSKQKFFLRGREGRRRNDSRILNSWGSLHFKEWREKQRGNIGA